MVVVEVVALLYLSILLPSVLLRLKVFEIVLVETLRLKIGMFDLNILCTNLLSSCILRVVGYNNMFEIVCKKSIV